MGLAWCQLGAYLSRDLWGTCGVLVGYLWGGSHYFMGLIMGLKLVPNWSLLGPDLCGTWCLFGARLRPYLRIGIEDRGEKPVFLEGRRRAMLCPCLFAHALDTRPGLLDEGDAVEHIGKKGIAADALPAEVGKLHPLGQAAGAGDLDPVGIDLHEDIGPFHEPVAMHDRIGDGFTQGLHRIFRDVLPAQPFNPIGRAGVALDEAQAVLDIRNDAAGKILAVQDVHLVCALRKETGDVRLVEKMSDVFGKEEDPGIAEKEFGAGTLGCFDVDQNVLDAGPAGDAAQPEPGIVFLPVEVLGAAELRADRGIETDSPFAAEEIPDLIAAELLGNGALPPEITVAALHRLGLRSRGPSPR